MRGSATESRIFVVLVYVGLVGLPKLPVLEAQPPSHIQSRDDREFIR
jgi:hypothetical protein